MRRCLTSTLVAVAMITPVAAFAQDANCPPGAWFCEDVQPPEAAPDAPSAPDVDDVDEPADLPDAAPEAAPEPAPRARPRQHAPRKHPPRKAPRRAPPAAAPPPVVVYQQSPAGPPPQIVIVAPGTSPPPRVIVRTATPPVPPAPPPPPPPKRRWHPEWGINLRLEGVALGRDRGAAENAGMGGLGASLRYRPVPAFAFDVGVDVLAGIDYNGFQRTEVPLSLSGILFVNPRSKVQFYFLGGLDISHAEVEPAEDTLYLAEDGTAIVPESTQYDYFGGHGGIGLEFRLSRRVALNIDGLAFIRNRTDDGQAPEFTDPDTGRTTDTSGGGLFRGGITFYW